MRTKSIVLFSNASDRKAVLTLEEVGGDVIGRVRLYNFNRFPEGIMSLGFKNDKNVIKCGLTQAGTNLYNFKTTFKTLPENFTCALVSVHGGEAEPLLYGTSFGRQNASEIFASVINSLYQNSSIDSVKDNLDKFDIDYDPKLKEEIENEIDKNINSCNISDCENCKYKAFYDKMHEGISSAMSEKDENIDEKYVKNDEKLEKIDEKDEFQENDKKDLLLPSFYGKLKKQIDELLNSYESEEYLESIIPDSKWVKVDYEGTGDYYVFGLVYANDEVKYICYGVPAVYSKNPPKEISGYPFWLPLENDHENGFGYWITYQDAETGESVKAISI